MLSDFEKAELGLTPLEYAIKYVIPLTALSIILISVIDYFYPIRISLMGIKFNPLFSIPFIILLFLLFLPHFLVNTRANEIEQNLHLFITYLGTVATSNPPLDKFIKLAAEKKEYGPIADEMRKISLLASSWKTGITDALRYVAMRTPSIIFADFLARFAHATATGEPLAEFLAKQQNVVMNDFELIYKRGLYGIEVMKEMYTSLITALAFVLAFIVVYPMLTRASVVSLFMLSILIFVIAEVIMITGMHLIAPKDKIKHDINFTTEEDIVIRRGLVLSIAASIILGILVFSLLRKYSNYTLIAAIATTPLMYAGYLAGRYEHEITRRDGNYPAFIRSYGATLSSQTGSMVQALRSIRLHNFGPLTPYIERLYRRLKLRGETENSWRLFGAETGSKLIYDFTNIFVESVVIGGHAGKIGAIINNNFIRILGLRKQRYNSMVTFRGVLYGTMVGLALAVYITSSVIYILQYILGNITIPTEIIGFGYNVTGLSLLNIAIFLAILIHAIGGAIMIKLIDGGLKTNALFHFVILMWIAAIISVIVPIGMQKIFGITQKLFTLQV